MSDLLSATELAAVESVIDAALMQAASEIDVVEAVEQGDLDHPFWYVRIAGDAKAHFSAEFTLGQRTLICESYFMPEPEENREQVFEHLLVRNRSMQHLHFVIGGENAVYLRGQVDNRVVVAGRVDALLASVYDYTEQYFVPAMRMGFASRFTR